MKTMYSPSHYSEDRSDLIFEIINKYSFATVITQGTDGPFVSHLPLILDSFEGRQTLLGHCARPNPQWKHFAEGQTVTVLFHGPHSYISPAWYEPQPDNVPTWNYATVHVQGTATTIDHSDQTYEVLNKIVKHFESDYETGWTLPTVPSQDLLDLVQGIVAFRLEIKDVQAKFKLSQKQNSTDRATVMRELPHFSTEHAALADYMKRIMT